MDPITKSFRYPKIEGFLMFPEPYKAVLGVGFPLLGCPQNLGIG